MASDRLRERVEQTRAVASDALRADEWICSDGHSHPRPEKFTANRLALEVERRNPRNDWTSSEVSLGIRALVDEGVIAYDQRWQMTVVARGPEPREETP